MRTDPVPGTAATAVAMVTPPRAIHTLALTRPATQGTRTVRATR
jgi:hypothetical protein